jgi:HD superfamily phosphodiesterase
MVFKKGNKAWNRGLTKETDDRLKKHSENMKHNQKNNEHLEKIHKFRKGKSWKTIYGKKYEDYEKKQRLAKIGEKNWSWKGGISQNYYKRLIQREDLTQKCQICGSKRFILIHHKDKNRKNNSLKNLIIVCRSCHAKIHKIIPPLRVSKDKWIARKYL